MYEMPYGVHVLVAVTQYYLQNTIRHFEFPRLKPANSNEVNCRYLERSMNGAAIICELSMKLLASEWATQQ